MRPARIFFLFNCQTPEAVDKVIDMFSRTRNNQEFVSMVKKMKFI